MVILPTTKRLLPISSIRFILAVWVVLGHYAPPMVVAPQNDTGLSIARAIVRNAFNGPAAVVIFFVISGLCVHFPNRTGVAIDSWRNYYTRRYLRILVPMGVAIALSVPLNMDFGLFTNSILWSLLAEEIYYFIYPGVLRLRYVIGWRKLLSVAWLGAVLVICTDPRAKDFPSFGPELNWALGLPCWLLGMRMAERVETLFARPIGSTEIWTWRAGVWMLSILASLLRFHTSVGFPWTLNMFAIVGALWLEREIQHYGFQPRRLYLENAGEASYSIYLTHTHGPTLLRRLSFTQELPPFFSWGLSLCVIGMTAAVFYFIVEKPSHEFARSHSRSGARTRERPSWQHKKWSASGREEVRDSGALGKEGQVERSDE